MAFRSRRHAIAIADGFYEWTGERSDRRPTWFHDPSGAPLLMAGLLDEGAPPATPDATPGPPTFTVLTAPSRPPVAAIHDRMPVLLSPEGARQWLLGEPPRVVAPGEVVLAARAVSPRVNGTAHDDPACLEPPDEKGKQLELF